jgi:hypothetical protein
MVKINYRYGSLTLVFGPFKSQESICFLQSIGIITALRHAFSHVADGIYPTSRLSVNMDGNGAGDGPRKVSPSPSSQVQKSRFDL